MLKKKLETKKEFHVKLLKNTPEFGTRVNFDISPAVEVK